MGRLCVLPDPPVRAGVGFQPLWPPLECLTKRENKFRSAAVSLSHARLLAGRHGCEEFLMTASMAKGSCMKVLQPSSAQRALRAFTAIHFLSFKQLSRLQLASFILSSSISVAHHKSPFIVRSSARQARGEGTTVLVIGGGGREHALCYGLQQSSTCDAVFCAPGNPGITAAGDATCIPDLDISISSHVITFCREQGVGLVVVGPEAPLVAGLVDDLQAAGIVAFGPSANAASLEGSKDFMKSLCMKYDIPTAKYKSFTDAKHAKRYIKKVGTPVVVKADGLAAGKGVIIATTLEEAFTAVDTMLVDKVFGSAGGLVIVEEFLDGEEVSFFALVDGENAVPMASAQDHKRVGDGDTGPNTGGMGAYSPAPILTPELEAVVMDTIILPTVRGMANEGCKFVGVLYAGLIIDKKLGIPKLLEYNVRFGDPECQVLIPRLQSDLVSTLLAACKGELGGVSLSWSDEAALVVVLASEGYPGKYKKGTLIRNLEGAEAAAPKTKIFHAGTGLDANGNVIATGGRVLGVAALGKDIAQAQERAYQAVGHVDWPEGFYRRDIGWRAVTRLQEDNKVKI